MRRLLAVIGALVLLAAVPAGAAARPPDRGVNHVQDAGCFGLETPAGVLEFYGFVDELFGTDAFLDLWAGEPFESDVVLTRDFDAPASVTFSGAAVSMSIPVVSTGVDPALESGVAQVHGTLTPAETISFTERFREGNRWFRITVEGIAYEFTGIITLPGVEGAIALDQDFCFGSDVVQTEFITRPNAFVQRFTGISGQCEVTNAAGDTAELFFFPEEDGLFLDGQITDSSGSTIFTFGSGTLDAAGATTFTLLEFDPETDEELPTTGTASITLTESDEAFTYTLRTSNGFQRVRNTFVDIEGSVSTSLGTFDVGECVITTSDHKEVTSPSSGPKPGGKQPANDLPSGAITLEPGSKVTIATKGAQQPAEGEFPCLTIVDPFDGTVYTFEAEHTVWYRIEGTGEPITVDTAGSSFDTVIAVYEGEPDGDVVACVDDTPLDPVGRTLQGQATFATTAGTTYWVQIGGLNEEPAFGPDPFVPYGTLKVSVRTP